MVTKDFLLNKLQPFENNKNYLVQEQTTNDIIQGIENTHKKYCSEYDKIYKYFVGSSVAQTAENVFDFLKKNIPYKPESGNNQCLHSPTAILCLNKNFDCKSYSLFTNGILDAYRRNNNKNFDLYYRYAGYTNKNLEHVFSVVKSNSGKKIIWVDAVLPIFDERKQPTNILDKKVTNMALVEINGIPNRNMQMRRNVNSLPPYVSAGKTLETVGGGTWENWWGIDKKRYEQLKAVMPDIGVCFLYFMMPTNYSKNNPQTRYPNLVFPAIVNEKAQKAWDTYMSIKAQTDTYTDFWEINEAIVYSITQKIGMTPWEYWSRFLGITYTKQDCYYCKAQNHSGATEFGSQLSGISFIAGEGDVQDPGTGPGSGDGTFEGSGQNGEGLSFETIVQIGKTILDIFINLFGSKPDLKFAYDPLSFMPKLSDWAGTKYPLDKSLIVSKDEFNGVAPPKKTSLLPIGLGLLAAKFLFFK
jgi:hypothetical protein